MRPYIALASLALAAMLALPIASVAHDRGTPDEFPRWRGTPELTVYFPSPPRMLPPPQAAPASIRPVSPHQGPPPRTC